MDDGYIKNVVSLSQAATVLLEDGECSILADALALMTSTNGEDLSKVLDRVKASHEMFSSVDKIHTPQNSRPI